MPYRDEIAPVPAALVNPRPLNRRSAPPAGGAAIHHVGGFSVVGDIDAA
jgi:hypothetical protein